jgi:hypothetical protein
MATLGADMVSVWVVSVVGAGAGAEGAVDAGAGVGAEVSSGETLESVASPFMLFSLAPFCAPAFVVGVP